MPRAENWPRRLDIWVNSCRSTAFAWGSHDCCLMAANGVYEITGVDIAATYRGTYSTQEEAAAIIESAGGLEPLVQSACEPLGWTRTKPALARRGDLVVFISPDTGHPSLGISLGRDSVFPAIGGGLGFIPTTQCTTAWRVD
jgi:hypothetical protein